MSAKVLRLGPAYIEQQQSGELSYGLTGAVDSLDAYFSQYLPQLVIAAILPLGILIIVFPMDPLSAVILLLTAPLIPVFMILVGRTTEVLTHRQYQTFSRMSAFFLDSLRGLTELKNLGRSADHAARLDTVSDRYRETTMRVLRVSFLSALVLELAATLSVAVIAVEIGIRLLYGQMDFQQAFFLLVIARNSIYHFVSSESAFMRPRMASAPPAGFSTSWISLKTNLYRLRVKPNLARWICFNRLSASDLRILPLCTPAATRKP